MEKTFKCPHCNSTQTTWKGYRELINGRIRLRRCKKCGRKYTSRRSAKND